MHLGPLLATLVAGLVLAFIFGAIAHKARLSPLVGYLLAGVAIGPSTPGFVADVSLAAELSEIGVILLMFGVGLHFSLKQLLSVRKIAIPGAIVQITAATLLGMGMAYWLNWSLIGGFVFGLSLSTASTVVLLRAMQERRLVDTERGRIAVGWLIVEDIAMVLALVMIPALTGAGTGAGGDSLLVVLGITTLKVIGFVIFMMVVGRRAIPALLHWVAHTGSRELFSLSVLAVALGVAAGAAWLFGVSFALGAFFAGMILAESTLSHRAAEESLPLRDAFAVLFFVSVGMLFDPRIVLQEPLLVAATLGIILLGKSIAAWVIVRLLGRSNATALTISASLAQIGEFSFILAGLGVTLKLFPEQGRDLILAGAILSILVNPVIFSLCERIAGRDQFAPIEEDMDPRTREIDVTHTTLTDHAIVVGYGRVGSLIGEHLRAQGVPYVVIEDRDRPVQAARTHGDFVIFANAANPRALQAANITGARSLYVAIPQSFEAGQVVMQAREASPTLQIIARSHSDDETTHLMKCGANHTIMGEREIAMGMLSAAQAG